MKLKKKLGLVLAGILCAGLLGGCGSGDKPTLKVYSWGEYIDTSLLGKFEKEYNCKVVYETSIPMNLCIQRFRVVRPMMYWCRLII